MFNQLSIILTTKMAQVRLRTKTDEKDSEGRRAKTVCPPSGHGTRIRPEYTLQHLIIAHRLITFRSLWAPRRGMIISRDSDAGIAGRNRKRHPSASRMQRPAFRTVSR